ncbi:MAG TPA: glycosyltransferase [Opitutaceae bacterium]|nr:glycosyltransferase [Opitutaceae bacterium]
MSAPLLLDLSHTSHTRARTGIQRVARSLRSALGESATGITYDPYLGGWRTLESWEVANLDAVAPTSRRSAQWPLTARVRSRMRRAIGRDSRLPAPAAGVVFPEIFSAAVGARLGGFAKEQGPRVAIFHDAIPLELPELSPPKTVARFPSYLRELLALDGIAAVSDDSRGRLSEYWSWLGIRNAPPVVTIPLGIERPASPARPAREPSDVPVVLSVGSIEARKNHLALLEACEQLWSRGVRFRLHLVGLPRAETGRAALARIAELRAAGRALQHDTQADDAAVAAAYAACTFTVYPSLREGFGLPVLESLAQGKPCLCLNRGALAESARGGGCVLLESVDAGALAGAIEHLLARPDDIARLGAEAKRRLFRSWSDYARELTGWMRTLSPRR